MVILDGLEEKERDPRVRGRIENPRVEEKERSLVTFAEKKGTREVNAIGKRSSGMA